MNVILDKKLKEYMNELGQKDLVLYVDMCST